MSNTPLDFNTEDFVQARNELTHFRSVVASRIEQLRQSARERLVAIKRRGQELAQQVEDARYRVRMLDDEDSGDWEYAELNRAEYDMREFARLQAEAERIMRRYNDELRRFGEFASSRILGAVAEADRALGRADAYIGVSADVSHGTPSGKSRGTGETRGSRGVGGASSLTAGLERLRASCSSEGLPDGYYWLELERLPESCFVDDPAGFEKFAKDKMAVGVQTLFEHVLPELARNPDADRTTFEEIDRRAGTGFYDDGEVRPDSRGSVFEVFLSRRSSAEVIIVGNVMDDGSINIMSGRHRLGVARELGYTHMPVRIGTSAGGRP
jgi:hypothetical protein